MMKTRQALVLVSLVALVSACAPPASMESAEIAAGADAWAEAFNAGDVEALVGLYTADSRLLPPNEPMAQGSDAIRSAFGEMIASGVKIELETVEAMAAADMGYRIGVYRILTPEGAEADRGKYIELWKKVDGAWKIQSDIWNSDRPPAPEGELMVITHEVEDAKKWLAAWSGPGSRHELFAEHGVPQVSVLRSPDRPTLTGLVIRAEDMDAFQALLQSPEGAAAKSADGVKDPTMRVLTEVK